MSDTESDASLDTEELNEIKDSIKETFEEVEVKGIEREPIKKKVEKLNKNIKDLEEVEYTKKVKGRPKTKEIIKTEKIIYMIPNKETGEYERITNPPKLTAKDLKKIEVEKKAREQEMEMGKKLTRKKNGQIDKRSSRTLNNGRSEAQINATKKMLEKNKQLREARKNTKTEETTKIMKKEIKESIVEVVSQPAEEVKKKRERSEEQIKKDNLRKAISMFS